MTSFQKQNPPSKATNNNNAPPAGNMPGTPTPQSNAPINGFRAPEQQSSGMQPPFNPPSNGYGMPLQQMSPAQMPATPAPAPTQARQASPAVLAPPLPEQGTMQLPQAPQVVNGKLILHRSEHFFLRTAYRPGNRPNPLRKPTGHTKMLPTVMPSQHGRVADGQTRMLPSVEPINPLKKERFPVPAWLEAMFVVIALIGSFIAHAINMFNFPRYELDEGTYMSSAWSILHGMITPYAYGYGHPPLAWIQIAAWIQLTGGFFTFGNALNSGRVLMVFYATFSSLLVYLITRRLGGNRSVGILALVIFSLSPLSLTYQRQVLLDNVATFWLLLSLYLLVVGNSRLLYIVCSALCFGITFLSKEVLIFFLPGMLYAVWLHTTKFQRKFAMVAFTYSSIAVCSSFVLMAILKGELLPYSWHLPWDTHDHLSMIQTFLDQGQRGQNEGSFKASWLTWLAADNLFMLAGLATVIFNLFIGWWYRKQLLLSLLTLSYWILLIRGGVVLSFYLIPLIPLTAMNAAMAFNTLTSWIVKVVRLDFIRIILLLGIAAALIPYDLHTAGNVYTQHPTSVQTDAMNWVRDNIPRNDFVIINSYLYTDMHVPGGEAVGNGAIFPYANVYVNVATDPELYHVVLQENWDRIDYIVADSEVLSYIQGISATSTDPGHILRQALDHSILRVEFKTADHADQFAIDIYQVEHKSPPPIAALPPGNNGNRRA
jgi:4-amino-4-deoxy-L-arabinose transferase-like glycosyltransferase